jgi:inner membrane protein
VIVGLISTVLPDISNVFGFGRVMKPVSHYINQQWGHRTITHSWVIIVAVFAVCSLLKAVTGSNVVWYFLLGVFAHIALDMMNISGVRFFYPDKMTVVIPSEHDVRIGTGSRREKRLAFALFILVIVSLPLGLWGYERTFRFLAGSHTAAVEEYKAYIDKNEVFVTITQGINRISQEPVSNISFKVIAAMPKKLTLVETETGKRITIGQVEEAIIETKKMSVKIGVPIKSSFSEIDAEKEGWRRILSELESPYSYAIGEVKLSEKPVYVHDEKDIWEGIEVNEDIVTMSYSGLEAVRKLKEYPIVKGKVKIRKEISEEGILGPLKREEDSNRNTVSFLMNVSYDSLRVVEGQYVDKGDIIAIDPEARRYDYEIEALMKSQATKEAEEEKAEALQDRSLSLKREMDQLDQQIRVQQIIAEKAGTLFKEAEQARLKKFQSDSDNLNKEYEDIQRNIRETKDYISKRITALKQETESKIRALSAQRETYYRRSPYTGKIVAVYQKNANVFEITVQRDLQKNANNT